MTSKELIEILRHGLSIAGPIRIWHCQLPTSVHRGYWTYPTKKRTPRCHYMPSDSGLKLSRVWGVQLLFAVNCRGPENDDRQTWRGGGGALLSWVQMVVWVICWKGRAARPPEAGTATVDHLGDPWWAPVAPSCTDTSRLDRFVSTDVTCWGGGKDSQVGLSHELNEVEIGLPLRRLAHVQQMLFSTSAEV